MKRLRLRMFIRGSIDERADSYLAHCARGRRGMSSGAIRDRLAHLNPMDETEPVECPFCMESMQVEERDQTAWLICPNGCPTEMEIAVRKPMESADATPRSSAAKS